MPHVKSTELEKAEVVECHSPAPYSPEMCPGGMASQNRTSHCEQQRRRKHATTVGVHATNPTTVPTHCKTLKMLKAISYPLAQLLYMYFC